MTLLELIAMAVVVGILTAIGVPTYRATIERQYCRQSQDLLLATYTAERVYQLAQGSYLAPATDAQWQTLGLDNPTVPGAAVSYAIATTGCAPAPCFLASATRIASGDVLMTIDQDRLRSSPSGRCEVVPD